MNISIIGTGYVGLVTGTCLADFGLSVTCVDQDETKISLLNKESKVIFIAVGTPSNNDGSANLVQIEEVAKQIALSINNYKVIVIKSTVPVGTTRKINEIINKTQSVIARSEATKQSQPSSKSFYFDLVSNPEFLREGSAVYDFTHPDKIEYFDPLAMENSRRILPDLIYCQNEYETAEHCDALADWLISRLVNLKI
jgi:UDPglucose 6-dehydrogenase